MSSTKDVSIQSLINSALGQVDFASDILQILSVTDDLKNGEPVWNAIQQLKQRKADIK
jgi:hypothetical protein